MRLLRSPLQSLVALLALAAVLLGALEHEDLILQDADHGQASAESNHANHFSTPLHDAGTEGVFRSDPCRFWLSPRARLVVATGLHVATFARWLPASPLGRPARRDFIGLVALRL